MCLSDACSREYPSRIDAGRAYGTALKLAMAAGLGVAVDQDALVSGPEMEHFARMHMGAVSSAGGTATMSGPHAARIQSAGGTAGGPATMSGPHAARIHSAGGMTGAGGKAGLGKKRGIYKKKHQTAAQAAHAAKMRAYRAANRAVGAH